VRRVGRAKKFSQSTIDSLGGKIFTYGSFTLGVHGPESDIDTLIVAPKSITQADFFAIWPPTFKEMSEAELITEFNPVPDAFVPIIKFEYNGVPIDLIFASLPSQSTIPKDMELDDLNMLRGLDQQAMRSVNGTRVARELLELVPQPKSFRHALRAIKMWAKQRAIYGFVYGFPGGIAWVIMVARICQLYPFACGATIIAKFFNLMYKWNWPRPIMLKEVESSGPLNLPTWNPAHNHTDRSHLMPIITPAYPSMCATHSVTQSTLKIMLGEFQRADEIIGAIQAGKKSWADLFQRHTFFTQDYKYYLSVVATATTKDAHDSFHGLVGSKVRSLAKSIEENVSGGPKARTYVQGFERVHQCANDEEIERVRQGILDYEVKEGQASQKDGGNSNGDVKTIYTMTFYIGLKLPEGQLLFFLLILYYAC